MKLKNNFSQRTRELFMWNYECFVCGKNTWNALHHIKGRCSNSPLNAAPVCNDSCHINKGFSYEDDKVLLQKTLKYLLKKGYKLTKKDEAFIIEHIKYYS